MYTYESNCSSHQTTVVCICPSQSQMTSAYCSVKSITLIFIPDNMLHWQNLMNLTTNNYTSSFQISLRQIHCPEPTGYQKNWRDSQHFKSVAHQAPSKIRFQYTGDHISMTGSAYTICQHASNTQ